tara:strand:+ start:3679 stop:4356 length:678 start_codon:yes stop_codon:yes gene_type:complete
MNITLLITCYNGDYNKIINYVKNKINNVNIILYNKKNKDFGVPVKNVGVDAYDKLHYIINNYDNLPDIIIFSTDSILSEDDKKAKKIKYIIENINILKNKSGLLTGNIYKIPKNNTTFELSNYKNIDLIRSTIKPYDKWFYTFINNNVDINNTYISKKSVFAVTKDLILSNSKNFYINLLKDVEKHSVNGHDSEVPHYFERAWVEIFCKNDVSKMFYDEKTYSSI